MAEERKSILLVFDEDKEFPGLAVVNGSLREAFRSELGRDSSSYSGREPLTVPGDSIDEQTRELLFVLVEHEQECSCALPPRGGTEEQTSPSTICLCSALHPMDRPRKTVWHRFA